MSSLQARIGARAWNDAVCRGALAAAGQDPDAWPDHWHEVWQDIAEPGYASTLMQHHRAIAARVLEAAGPGLLAAAGGDI